MSRGLSLKVVRNLQKSQSTGEEINQIFDAQPNLLSGVNELGNFPLQEKTFKSCQFTTIHLYGSKPGRVLCAGCHTCVVPQNAISSSLAESSTGRAFTIEHKLSALVALEQLQNQILFRLTDIAARRLAASVTNACR